MGSFNQGGSVDASTITYGGASLMRYTHTLNKSFCKSFFLLILLWLVYAISICCYCDCEAPNIDHQNRVFFITHSWCQSKSVSCELWHHSTQNWLSHSFSMTMSNILCSFGAYFDFIWYAIVIEFFFLEWARWYECLSEKFHIHNTPCWRICVRE